jgi:hypothetical protein
MILFSAWNRSDQQRDAGSCEISVPLGYRTAEKRAQGIVKALTSRFLSAIHRSTPAVSVVVNTVTIRKTADDHSGLQGAVYIRAAAGGSGFRAF